ncbi:MAG: rhamnulokinase, partial [Clostridia bacterium]|nr:rhamnulokinase [Clostridia bacterium]
MRYYLAVDIGASSGRHIVGYTENGSLQTKEVYRFPNGVKSENGHLVWDIDSLLFHVKAGIEKAKEQFGAIESLSVDTWGVDYVLLKGDEIVYPVYAYRDDRTKEAIEKVHAVVPFSTLYRHTG